MSEGIVINLTASFVDLSSSLPWGTYNDNSDFQSFCDSMVKYFYRKMGGDVLQLEVTNLDVYTSVEEATLEYSSMINSYQAKSMLADILGSATGSLEGKEQKLARMNLALANRRADAYSSEALVGGTRTLHSASINVKSGQQTINLQSELEAARNYF